MTETWPVVDGTFVVGELTAPVAVCTLTTEDLPQRLATVRGVAIAGQVYTANLGIERIILNVTSNPSIRFLVLCGKDSKLFLPGQSLSALAEDGIDGSGRIVGAEGYDPVLPEVSPERIAVFRRQVEMVDWTGEDDPDALSEVIEGLAARDPGPLTSGEEVELETASVTRPPTFVPIRPGGRRQPLQYDPKGYFVITVDREEEQIVLQHYLPDHTAAHEMRGRLAEPMLLGLLREGLISQLSHAGYLGVELAKAEAGLHLELRYKQDRPLRRPPESAAAPPPAPQIRGPFTLEQLLTRSKGDPVDVVMAASIQGRGNELSGTLLEPTMKAPYSTYYRTDRDITLRWTPETHVAMGEMSDLVVGGIFRASAVLIGEMVVEASSIAVLSEVATVLERDAVPAEQSRT